MRTLHGVGVLVTRPTVQAATLSDLLQQHGASTWVLPALDIIATPAAFTGSADATSPTDADLVIFTSANAVRFGAALLHDAPHTLTLAAIGPATARALQAAGYRSTVEPQGSVDSEGLLAHPRLAHLRDQKVLIVKGHGGRGLLEAELTARGARISAVDVYERRPARHTATQLAETAQRIICGDIQVVTATSLEIATHLWNAAPSDLRAAYERVHWLVPGTRIADGVRALGCRAPLLQAASAEDQELVSALERWRSGGSTA